MKKCIILFLPFFILLFLACPPRRPYPLVSMDQNLHYTITLDTSNGLSFLVDYQMLGNQSGTTKIYTPDEWGPAHGLKENIKDIEVSNAIVIEKKDNSLLLQHKPGDLLILKYRIAPSSVYPVENADAAFHPILQKDFFQFYGNGFFFYPADLNQVDRSVRLTWLGFPEDWVIHNSYGSNQREQSFRWRDSLSLEAIFVGGDYRIHKIVVQDDPVYVAMRGQEWGFQDAEYLDLLERVITQQRAFWNDYNFDYFTVTLAPFQEDKNYTSYQGTGLQNAFALNATPKVKLDNFKYLFSHELMHEWIGLQIKTADPEGFRFWFSEGFTDYFTFINMRECGMLDEQGYLDEMNKVIKRHYSSSVREAPNDQIAEHFFTDYGNYGKLAYRRGCIFAMYLDWKIRIESEGDFSLKNAMQDFLASCRYGKQRLTDELFLSTINKYLKSGINADFEKYIQNGTLIPLEDWMLGNNTIVKYKNTLVFDLGYDLKRSTELEKIVGVKEKSNAYKAGLRNGQIRLGEGYYKGRTDIKAEVHIKVDGKKKTIKYYPAGPSEDAVPQFVFK